jgi:hypothetical protein
MRAGMKYDPLALPLYWDLSVELIWLHRFDEAREVLEKSGDLFPGNSNLAFTRLFYSLSTGDRKMAERAETLDGASPGARGISATLLGRPEEGRQEVRELESLRSKTYVDPTAVIYLCIALKDQACATRWLRYAYEDRSNAFLYSPLVARDHPGILQGLEPLLREIR